MMGQPMQAMPDEAREKDIRFYVKELRSDECQCGGGKTRGKSLCYRCYSRLPVEMKKALYRRLGSGYEEAYEAAVRHLSLKEGME